MKNIYAEQIIDIPEDVKLTVDRKRVHVVGKHGELEKSFAHIQVDAVLEGNKLKAAMWLCDRKQQACLKTFCSLIRNMITGVREQFQYKMRLVYSHYPISINVVEDGTVVEIRNFLGQRLTRILRLPAGVVCTKSATVKDELILRGINNASVGRACALLHQNALVRKKDIRLFLDGIYVSEKSTAVASN